MPVLYVTPFILLLGYPLWFYNRLVVDRNRMKEGWSGIEVQLKRRHDLIPQLVEVVKAYASHEKSTLAEVTALRNELSSRTDAGKEQQLTRKIRPLLLLAEAYPELKAANNFRQLSENLVEVEDHLQMARRYYNGCVRNYNNRVEGFPGVLMAPWFKASRAAFFEVESATERLAPHVKV
jgi:LemA protein